ncbi:hypothetical protein E5673_16705 [Sphingomonas sp. PAMC26645]|uniref:RcnB family protein n=1 Tax=Sphingomonas sp. PAMC26645 TaxID=2565555 RepID=UPI00109DA22E|nr:RcnB family protein [Sphingomonas sp. PAMC26645]QCB43668.1 hypothetical protein E5673_16705 [Sphingomonas sp. PAMC26645]
MPSDTTRRSLTLALLLAPLLIATPAVAQNGHAHTHDGSRSHGGSWQGHSQAGVNGHPPGGPNAPPPGGPNGHPPSGPNGHPPGGPHAPPPSPPPGGPHGHPPGGPPPPHHSGGTVYYPGGNPNWWHGNVAFVGYVGPRPGYYYAPSYGYYAVSPAYSTKLWIVGSTVPASFQSYVVVNPAMYGLPIATTGYRWIYVNTNMVLIRRSSGVVIRSVPRVW